MKLRRLPLIFTVLALLCLLSACTDRAEEIQDTAPVVPMTPTALYTQIADAAPLPAMITLTAEELFDVIGIDPAWYTESAAYFAADGTSPDEILIFRAVDDASASALEEVLHARLQYKQDSAAQYLTENQAMLEDGTVRRDGLTVALLVTADMDAVLDVYRP